MAAIVEGVIGLVRHAGTVLRRSPGYSSAIVLSLGLSLGLNTTIFAVTEHVLRRPLPFRDEGRLLTIGKAAARPGFEAGSLASTTFEMNDQDLRVWRQHSRTLGDFAVFSRRHFVVAANESPEYVEGAAASPNLLRVLGTAPALGRWFGPDEVNARVVVLSHSLWQRQFSGESQAIGKVLRIRAEPWKVIGVMPAGIGLPIEAQYWIPSSELAGQIVARPPSDNTVRHIQSELRRLSPSAANLERAGYSAAFIAIPLREHLFGSARPALRVLATAAAFLLLIAAANVANLVLARTLQRQREFAVRLTLGGTRLSIARIVLAENFGLALIGAAVGVLLAFWATGAVVTLSPEEIRQVPGIGISARSVLFANGAAMVAALLVSCAPLITMNDGRLQAALSRSDRRTGRSMSLRVRRTLVAAQLAIALLLLSGTGLLLRSVAELTRKDRLGFSPDGVVIATVQLFGAHYRQPEHRREFLETLRHRLGTVPGLESVSVGPPPLVGGRGEGIREGFSATMTYSDPLQPEAVPVTVWVKNVDAKYLRTYRIPLRVGRDFTIAENRNTPRAAILNATAAKLFFPGRDVVGQHVPLVAMTRDSEPAPEVVGVVEDVLQRDLALEAKPEVLLLISQQRDPPIVPTIAVRATGDPRLVIDALRRSLLAVDPTLAAMRLQSMREVVELSLVRHRFLLFLLGSFAMLAVAISVIGLYAIVAYFVTQRSTEIGVRMALGAQGRHIYHLVLREGVVLIVLACCIGMPTALMLARFMEAFVYHVPTYDWQTFTGAPLLLALVALLAAYVPARRAARLHPAETLRSD